MITKIYKSKKVGAIGSFEAYVIYGHDNVSGRDVYMPNIQLHKDTVENGGVYASFDEATQEALSIMKVRHDKFEEDFLKILKHEILGE
jgi:hypothetical protein